MNTTSRIYGLDLARGLALAGIVIANALTSFSLYWGQPIIDPTSMSGELHQGLYLTFSAIINHRFFPLFATLFGFGLGVLAGRGMRYLRIRLGILAVIGALHLSLLYYGDIVMIYALTGLLLTFCMNFSSKVLATLTGLMFAIHGMMVAVSYNSPFFVDLSTIDARLSFQSLMFLATLVGLPVQVLTVGPFIVIGFLIHRHKILLTPPPLRFLAPAILAFFALGFIDGVYELNGTQHPVIHWSSTVLGSLAGPLMVMVSAHFRPHRLLDPIAVLGRYSLSAYIFYSLYFWMVAYVWSHLDLEVVDIVWAAVMSWVVSLCIANTLNATKTQGPTEALLRSLTHRLLRKIDHDPDYSRAD